MQLAINLINFSKRCSPLPSQPPLTEAAGRAASGKWRADTELSLPLSLSANRDAYLVYLPCVILLSSSLISIIIIIAIMNNLCQLSNLQDYSNRL